MSDEVVVPVKPVWQSRTVLLNVLIALAGALSMLGILPGVHDFISAHQDLVLTILGALGVGLRLITKGKISIE